MNQHGRAPKRQERTFVLLEKPQMSVYNTSWVDIPGEFQKIAQVTTREVGNSEIGSLARMFGP